MRSKKGSVTSIRSKTSSGVPYMKPIKKVRTGKEIESFKKELDYDDHVIGLDQLVLRYGTDLEGGLTQPEAEARLKLNGPNCLVATATTSKWIILARHLFGGFNILLWIGAILTFTGYIISYSQNDENSDDLGLGIMLVCVILFTGFFGFYQESTNINIMDTFNKMVPKFAMVIRSGRLMVLPSEEIVVGDLVKVTAGDMVPADMRIIEAQALKVDNSALTGESLTIARGPECTHENPLETKNIIFYTTSVVEGSGTGIVIKCGEETAIGKIAALTSSLEQEETLIHKEIRRFVRIITIMAFSIATLFFIISMIIGYNFFKSFSFFIAILVANVPEGLPVTLTACLTLTAKRMAKKKCLVKKLECIESLGACNVICSDKTGTLTQNIMSVSHIYFDDEEVEVLGDFSRINMNSEAFKALSNVATLCSRASFLLADFHLPTDQRQTSGDASEAAILKLMEKMFGDVENKREQVPKVCEIPFNSTNKYQVSIHKTSNGRFLLVMKGAPERVIDFCSTILQNDKETSLTSIEMRSIKQALARLSHRGERVLAFADKLLPETYREDFPFRSDIPNFSMTELRFVGLISMIDPPRATVPEAVSKCRSAGIRVIMVTGDHPITAAAIAKKVGIISPGSFTIYDQALKTNMSVSALSTFDKLNVDAAVITGSDLRDMSEEELANILLSFQEIVFARTSPQQKLKIVEALQKLGAIVAVTGDGVNDSPALRKANIGIAMGITGSDVSKDAADMILLDDNFSTIVTGIEEGRLIFDNLKKSVAFVLTSNVPEIVPFLLLVTLNIPEALSVMAIIVIDIGTDLFPAISLAYEKPEADIMKRPPRDPNKDKLINAKLIYITYFQIGIIQACASMCSYFYVMVTHGFRYERLIGLRPEWESTSINDLDDSYEQEWTFYERKLLTRQCISAYFLSLVVTQIVDLLVCKTRRLSLFQQSANYILGASIVFELAVAILVVYCPVVNTALQFETVNPMCIIPALPFALLIFVNDELRKFFIRKYPNGFMYRETYY